MVDWALRRSDRTANAPSGFTTPHFEHLRNVRSLRLAPAELIGSPAHVTVRASDLAPGDLVPQALEGGIAAREVRDLHHLPIHMIEVKNDGIRLSAIDARMRDQILANERLIAVEVATGIRVDVGDMVRPIFPVPLALTVAAEELVAELGRPIERLDRFDLTTPTAPAYSIPY